MIIVKRISASENVKKRGPFQALGRSVAIMKKKNTEVLQKAKYLVLDINPKEMKSLATSALLCT